VTSDAAPVIEVEDVRVAFGAKQVLRGIDLTIRAGETVALMGESGCGKTVLLRAILGLLTPQGGRVRLFGQEIAGLSDDDLLPLRKRMSVVYQGGALFSGMNVGENIALELTEVLKLGADEVAARVKEALEAVGLGSVDPRMAPEELSGGMKKRLSVARAIAPRPEILFYDEPTSGLDPINSARILRLIDDLHDRYHATSIVVTHDVRGACEISDRIVLLHEGLVAFDGPPVAFLASPDPVVVAFRSLAAGPAASLPSS
jgi:phospholipid/cholesterol/gamma-HCH transport system ATP-binding protein